MLRAKQLQLIFLLSLMTLGVLTRDFSLSFAQVALALGAAVGVHLACVRALHLPAIGLHSTLITACGCSLLLRSEFVWAQALAAAIGIASKFFIRVNHRHIFNPANLGVVALLLCSNIAWVSPGQWGSDAAVALFLVGLGLMVTQSSRVLSSSVVFLGAYAALLALWHITWLGNPWAIWWHHLSSGSLLLFSFFMISDPATLPRTRFWRVLHLLFVAGFAWAWQSTLFHYNGVIWGLFLSHCLSLGFSLAPYLWQSYTRRHDLATS